MKKTVLFIILGLLVAVGGYYYYEWLHRPEQTIVNILKALDKKDKSLWDSNVAQQTFVANSYQMYKDQFKSTEEDDMFLMVDKLVRGAYSSIMEKGITDDVNAAINDYFTSNPEELLIVDKQLLNGIISILDYKSLKVYSVKLGEKNAMIEFSVVDKLYHHEFIIRSLLEKQDKKWKLIGIVNFNELVATIKDKEKDRRNLAISEKTKEMQRYLEIKSYYGVQKEHWLKEYPILNMIPIFRTRHYLTVQNLSRQDITKFAIKMTFKDESGWIIIEKMLVHDETLKAGDSIKMRYDLYDPVVHGQMEMGRSPEFNHVSLTLESGQVIENEENKEIKYFE